MIISNKTLYQLEIKSTKLVPVIIAILYISNTTCSYYYTDIREFSMIGGASLLLLSKLYVSSFTYKLCIHHRIFIYYILVCNIIDIIDYYMNGIPISDRDYLLLNVILFGIFLILYIIFKRIYDFHNKKCS